MIQSLAAKDQIGFDWIDVSAPTNEELTQLASRFNLHEASLKDCMQPDHLPKYELFDDYTFVIFRMLDKQPVHEADTIQELTNKIAIFFHESYLITIHMKEQELIETVKNKRIDNGTCDSTIHLLNTLIRESILTFDLASIRLSETLDYYEERVFLRQQKAPILRGLYFVKRKIDVIRKILLLSYEIIDNIDVPQQSTAYTRDLRDLYIRTQTFFDNLSENTAQLLSLYFSISAQRTNETMRILTVFSVFFMPLTFIVGVYGMNFRFMPELAWPYGYPAVMVLMAALSVAIYIWFRKKGWL